MYWFLIKSIVATVLSSQVYEWYASTKVGIYFQNRIDQFLEYIAKKYDITLMKKQSRFERDYPLMMERIEALENRQDARLYNKVSTKFGRLDHELEDDGKV